MKLHDGALVRGAGTTDACATTVCIWAIAVGPRIAATACWRTASACGSRCGDEVDCCEFRRREEVSIRTNERISRATRIGPPSWVHAPFGETAAWELRGTSLHWGNSTASLITAQNSQKSCSFRRCLSDMLGNSHSQHFFSRHAKT